DHFTTYPSLKAHTAKHGAGLSLIQIDAHCDTAIDEAGRIDHGTMFYHAAREGIVDAKRSIQVGIRTTYTDPSDFVVRDARAVHAAPIAETVAHIRAVVGDNPCYLTFDVAWQAHLGGFVVGWLLGYAVPPRRHRARSRARFL
ncbi:MAG: arginase family protein, partial [Pseudomonadota bacterium]